MWTLRSLLISTVTWLLVRWLIWGENDMIMRLCHWYHFVCHWYHYVSVLSFCVSLTSCASVTLPAVWVWHNITSRGVRMSRFLSVSVAKYLYPNPIYPQKLLISTNIIHGSISVHLWTCLLCIVRLCCVFSYCLLTTLSCASVQIKKSIFCLILWYGNVICFTDVSVPCSSLLMRSLNVVGRLKYIPFSSNPLHCTLLPSRLHSQALWPLFLTLVHFYIYFFAFMFSFLAMCNSVSYRV